MGTTAPMHVLLTGATGSVGVELVAQLLGLPQLRTLLCLVRGSKPPTRLRNALRRAGYGACALDPRLRTLPGDLLEPDLGLDIRTRHQLRGTLTHVIHGAASIRFDLGEEDTFPINVEGTRRLLALALDSGRPIRFAYLSTLFVVGRRVGLIPEGAGPTAGDFLNAYEASKWEAEQLIRTVDLDASIYRLPLLLGRARDGYVHHYLEAHMLLEAFARGWFPEFPGDGGGSLPLMPTDTAAREVLTLLFDHQTPESVHAISPGPALIDFSSLFDMLRSVLAEGGADVPPLPRFIDGSEGDAPLAELLLETTREYLLLPRRFEGGRHRRRLGPAPCPRTWVPEVLRHCIAKRWGRAS